MKRNFANRRKVGAQAGLKYINAFGLDHLDLQAEYNSIRPYTYSFRDSSASARARS